MNSNITSPDIIHCSNRNAMARDGLTSNLIKKPPPLRPKPSNSVDNIIKKEKNSVDTLFDDVFISNTNEAEKLQTMQDNMTARMTNLQNEMENLYLSQNNQSSHIQQSSISVEHHTSRTDSFEYITSRTGTIDFRITSRRSDKCGGSKTNSVEFGVDRIKKTDSILRAESMNRRGNCYAIIQPDSSSNSYSSAENSDQEDVMDNAKRDEHAVKIESTPMKSDPLPTVNSKGEESLQILQSNHSNLAKARARKSSLSEKKLSLARDQKFSIQNDKKQSLTFNRKASSTSENGEETTTPTLDQVEGTASSMIKGFIKRKKSFSDIIPFGKFFGSNKKVGESKFYVGNEDTCSNNSESSDISIEHTCSNSEKISSNHENLKQCQNSGSTSTTASVSSFDEALNGNCGSPKECHISNDFKHGKSKVKNGLEKQYSLSGFDADSCINSDTISISDSECSNFGDSSDSDIERLVEENNLSSESSDDEDLDPEEKLQTPVEKSMRIAQELLDTEKAYVKRLHLLNEVCH